MEPTMSRSLDWSTVDAIANAFVERIGPRIVEIVDSASVRALAGKRAVLSRQDAAVVVGLAPRTLEKLDGEGKGPRRVKHGRSVGYTLEALDEFVTAHQDKVVAAE
jgi:hypothetical protein